MIEANLSLALAVQSNRGMYAMLLGSGVSRSSQIPTGWEVVEDLIGKIAHIRGEDCGGNASAWYQSTFGAPPRYSDLLRELARTPAERSELLRAYFEPTPEQRESGIKMPTNAHKAIAGLVASGHIRVILTTNFDRLLESALDAAGVVPTVLSTPDAIEGSIPITHLPCVIVKLHGDYLDTRIRNTPHELETYDKRTNKLLDRILDEFGLVVCGWSAEWDGALRSAIERCPNRRFTTFWAVHGEITEEARRLIDLRQARVISITSADDFFKDLENKVESLERLDDSNPISTKVAAATVKRFLVDNRFRIDLHDLVMRETERVLSLCSPDHFPLHAQPTMPELAERLRRYEALTEVLRAVHTVGAYWGGDGVGEPWVNSLERLAYVGPPVSGVSTLLRLRRYPALVTIYAAGLAAVAAKKYRTLLSLLAKPRIRTEATDVPVISEVHIRGGVIETRMAKILPGLERHKTPMSDHLFEIFREPLREFVTDDVAYGRLFNRFEYLSGLIYMEVTEGEWAPFGRYVWNEGIPRASASTPREIDTEIAAEQTAWPLLRAGFCGGSVERLTQVKARLDGFLGRIAPGLEFS